jgi:hypothetical protein
VLANYTYVLTKCTRVLTNCTRVLTNYTRVLANYTCVLTNCTRVLANYTCVLTNYTCILTELHVGCCRIAAGDRRSRRKGAELQVDCFWNVDRPVTSIVDVETILTASTRALPCALTSHTAAAARGSTVDLP